MGKYVLLAIMVMGLVIFVSCSPESPNEIFSTAVLNANILHGFAGEGLQGELENPGVKLVAGSSSRTEVMKRKEIIETKIQFLESGLTKIKKLPQNGNAKNMVQASIVLHEFALPVYRSEYMQLAQLYDNGASTQETTSFAGALNKKYFPRFEELHKNLTMTGKDYASKNNIKVQWDISTSPRR